MSNTLLCPECKSAVRELTCNEEGYLFSGCCVVSVLNLPDLLKSVFQAGMAEGRVEQRALERGEAYDYDKSLTIIADELVEHAKELKEEEEEQDRKDRAFAETNSFGAKETKSRTR